MYNKWQVFIGILITLVGVMFLIGSIFDIDVGSLCFPTALIALGILLLLRPQLFSPDTPGRLKLLGNVRRYGEWQVTDEEIYVGVGDARLNMTSADISKYPRNSKQKDGPPTSGQADGPFAHFHT